jgi:hypothetical protein
MTISEKFCTTKRNQSSLSAGIPISCVGPPL